MPQRTTYDDEAAFDAGVASVRERIVAADLRHVAYSLCNFNADQLIKAGVLMADTKGNPAVGGSDWTRYNNDPLIFIIKLPNDRLENLASLINANLSQ